MREELIALLKEKLGDSPTPEDIVTYLENSGISSDTQFRKVLVLYHFPRMLTTTNKSARDIENELAERYGVSRETVYYIRTQRTGVKY